jgi:hypothetical protein
MHEAMRQVAAHRQLAACTRAVYTYSKGHGSYPLVLADAAPNEQFCKAVDPWRRAIKPISAPRCFGSAAIVRRVADADANRMS